ncbi:MAG: hypothetical protein LUG65_06865, partial [Clostridiales bacterium]|nr:hypothetical protein [Clostridiales bacterium]
GMYFVVFPSLDTVLDLVSPHKGVTLLLSLVVSTFADWIIGKIAKTKDNIWETLKKLIKFLYKEVQIDNYLERAGLFSRILRKIKESVTDRLTKHAERKDADQP